MSQSTRIEVFKDGSWRRLRLKDKRSVKYNALINRIGNTDSREISHTNTFSLPSTFKNNEILGINIYSPKQLAIALNRKFEAKYYVGDKLLQVGFLVINNTLGGSIQVNFIDGALNITEKWGSNTFKELLLTVGDGKQSDMVASINELIDYQMSKVAVVTPLTSVGARGYKLAVFPNNLNAIGDEFQIDDAGSRVIDTFNPYQSRPIFNAFSIFDLAAESYGYTTILDSSVDWARLKETFMVSSGLSENQRDDAGITTIERLSLGVSLNHYTDGVNPYELDTVVVYGSGTWTRVPESIPLWVNPPNFNDSTVISLGGDYLNKNCVYLPLISESFLGTIQFEADISQTSPPASNHQDYIYSIWENLTPASAPLFKVLPRAVDNSDGTKIDITINKSELNIPPAGGGTLIGIIIQSSTTLSPETIRVLQNINVTESYIPGGVISYDEFGQYESVSNDLTHAAPEKSVKELLSAIMQKEGMLMSINSIAKTIKFFTYGHYETQKIAGNYSDWSAYYRKYSDPQYNTDYGNSYARKNTISLSSPYPGNASDLYINNQGVEGKHKDFTTDQVKLFKDVTKISKVQNTAEYFEYENKGLGLVEQSTSLGSLTQKRADGTTQGSFSGLVALENVNYATLPNGVKQWYKLIDEAYRVIGKFMLPIDVIKNLDLSEPIYIDKLGGFFIIEEIAEYSGATEVVNVKLIKLIDNLIS